MKLFDHLNNLAVEKRDLTEEEVKTYSPFIINRFVSMSDLFLPVAAELNQYSSIPARSHNEFWQGFLPKRKQFFKYIKGKKENMDHERECLMSYFEVGERDVDSMLDILTKEQLKEITDKYKTLKGR